MNNIVDGFVFFYDNKFYNLFPQSHSGDIIAEVMPGDILYCFYDLDEAESARAQCIHRLQEWYELDLETDELTDYLEELTPVRVSDVLSEIGTLSLEIEAAYL